MQPVRPGQNAVARLSYRVRDTLDAMYHSTFLERPGEPRLRLGLWTPTRTRGAVLLTPGYAECLERWKHVAEPWCAAGFAVVGYDLRGQGMSQGHRGHVARFSDFTGDLFAVMGYLQSTFPRSEPPIAFGHSLGALITTAAALERPKAFRGLALASPFFGLALKPAAWKVYVGKKLTNVWPTYSEAAGIPLSQLTHDITRIAMMESDPLRIKRVTARWFTETESARVRVRREFGSLPMPIHCLAAGEDYVADVRVTQSIFASSSNPEHTLEVKPGMYHELHQELGREEYMLQFQRQFERWCPE